MKKTNIVLIVVIVILLAVCGVLAYKYVDMSQKYNNEVEYAGEIKDEKELLDTQLQSVKTEYESLSGDYEELSSDYDTLSDSYDTLYSEYEEYLAENEPVYETPSDLSEYSSDITYDNLARTPDEYEGKAVKFSGEVIQVLEGDGQVELRVAVSDDYEDVIYCYYDSKIVSERVLEGDDITFYGISENLLSYESTMGGTITIPAVLVEVIEMN